MEQKTLFSFPLWISAEKGSCLRRPEKNATITGMKTDRLFELLRRWTDLSGALSVLKETPAAEITGVQGGLHGFFLAEYVRWFPGPLVIVTPTEKESESLARDMDVTGLDFRVLPWWGTVPYRPAASGSPVFGERASVLASLLTGDFPPVLVMSQRAFLTPVPDPAVFASRLIRLQKGGAIDPVSLAEKLSVYGYMRVPRVSVKGEFALRGEVLDVFLPGQENACRLEFDFDRIGEIRLFDPVSQTSQGKLPSLVLYPVREILWTEDERSALLSALRRPPEKAVRKTEEENGETERAQQLEELADTLEVYRSFPGEELFFPLASEKRFSVLDYFAGGTCCRKGAKDPAVPPVFFLDYDRQQNAVESLRREYAGLYAKTLAGAGESPYPLLVPPPDTELLDFASLVSSCEKRLLFRTIRSGGGEESGPDGGMDGPAGERMPAAENIRAQLPEIVLHTEPSRSFFGNINYLREELTSLCTGGWTVCIFAETENQSLRIAALLKDLAVEIFPFNLSAGFCIPAVKLLVIQENEIFGRRRRIVPAGKRAKSSVIDTFVELNPGDYVVHVQHGIGQFLGIERVKIKNHERDYIKLAYADEETVFIPIEQVNLVQRYIGNEGENPRLDRIGSKAWENRKNRARKSVEDIARRLIDLYSRRKAARGFAFPKDTEWQTAFEAAFPYEETDDQLTCIAEVKSDMERPVPMDRLICGDVGYGKTEVAMRAAFKAVMGGKQVAFLAPTTILAEQHFETLKGRFRGFPVQIAQLSRFVPPKEQKTILQSVSEGKTDILVGTHRIIQKDVRFKDMGLMIIDEEQRFGVKDKERLKELRANIDCLAMSATPIPRTLHMSLLKIRDMSLLTTPPQNRQPVETVICEFNGDRVARAIRREAERGGQVFYLHNRVESLEETRIFVQSLVPEMLVDTAHGQMSASELDDVFRRFKMGGFHVLIATTIVENGIDIPNVNTIIIDRADMYGVSQLYQLRGRVGRSDRKAYAYLMYPENKSLSDIAMKRLQVISDFTELGSGFKIAMKDMEIRGAGNLLGKEQSGEICSVGFDMYLRLLDEAVQRLQNSDFVPEQELWLELEYSGYIPDTYISLPQTKMEFYKKIAAVSSDAEMDAVCAELTDRFGPFPEEVASLLSLAEIRIICKKLSVSSLKEKKSLARVEFSKVAGISVEKLLRLIQESGGRVRLDPASPNVILLETGQIGLREKSEYIREKLQRLL